MAETPKTPKDLKLKAYRRRNSEDEYENYMQAVLKQALTHPDVALGKRTH